VGRVDLVLPGLWAKGLKGISLSVDADEGVGQLDEHLTAMISSLRHSVSTRGCHRDKEGNPKGD